MVKTLEQAIAEVANLPDADQEQIGRKLLSHVEKLRQLRVEIDKGIRSLDAGQGGGLNIGDFIRQEEQTTWRSVAGRFSVPTQNSECRKNSGIS